MIGRFSKWKEVSSGYIVKCLLSDPMYSCIFITNYPHVYTEFPQVVNWFGKCQDLQVPFSTYWKTHGCPNTDLMMVAKQVDKFLTKMRKLNAFI